MAINNNKLPTDLFAPTNNKDQRCKNVHQKCAATPNNKLPTKLPTKFPFRKGITPVIAIVLLLMMTVAAAGAAFFWIKGLQKDITDKVEKQLITKMEVISSVCYGNTAQIELSIFNSGRSPVDMVPVSVFAFEGGSVLSFSSIINDENENQKLSNSDEWKKAQKGGGFSQKVNVTMDGIFDKGEYYKINLKFTNSDLSIDTDCLAK